MVKLEDYIHIRVPVGYIKVPVGKCHNQNALVKHGIEQLLEQAQLKGWVNEEGKPIKGLINRKFVKRGPYDGMYYFNIILRLDTDPSSTPSIFKPWASIKTIP